MTISDSVSLPLEYKRCCRAWDEAHDHVHKNFGPVNIYPGPLVTYYRGLPRMGTLALTAEPRRIVKRCPWCGKKK